MQIFLMFRGIDSKKNPVKNQEILIAKDIDATTCNSVVSKILLLYMIIVHLQANGLAAVGKYQGGLDSAAGGQSLFVAQHAY